MKKTILSYSLFVFVLFLLHQHVYAQIGHGTGDPSKASVVEMLSPSKGLLIPRVALTGLNSFSPIQGENGNSEAKTNSLLVYNTATAGTTPNNVTPGYYYWTSANQRWNRLVNDADIAALGLNVTADNGLTKDGDNIQLGGALTDPTSIETNATNTLAIEGLQMGNTTTDRVVVADPTSGVLKQLKAALPKFFYMPSVLVPTDAGQIPSQFSSYISFNNTAKTGSINLWGIYNAQFGTPMVKNGSAATLPVIPANELNYYITWYDDTVFGNVLVSDIGVLTYEVIDDDIDEGTFMNIVFEVRETPSS